jgi:hypothetical protein
VRFLSIRRIVGGALLGGLVVLGVTPARAAAADVCVTVDEARDTFSPRERQAALLLLTRQFEIAGEHVVAPGCATPYVVSHVQFGTLISITLSGPSGRRDATAHGIDDVPAVYSQMVRSLVKGVPMGAPPVVDRTNVTAAQAIAPNRVHSDSLLYARLGYGGIFGDRTYSGPSVGMLGYRRELDTVAIDVSFFNFQYKSSDRSYAFAVAPAGSSGMTGTWLKLEVLRFMNPTAARSLYAGGGLGWSVVNLDNDNTSSSGSGLQGELTLGYEVGRTSTVRMFLQADAGLPFYKLRSETFSYAPGPPFQYSTTTARRYAPSATLSVGLGWQRGGGQR